MVLAQHALHDFAPMGATLKRVFQLLKPGGLVLFEGYAGPSGFAWTPEQCAAVEEFLGQLPDRFRERASNGELKTRMNGPGDLSPRFRAASNAKHSARIRDIFTRGFELLVERGFGGTILCPLFDDIAHHFAEPDPKTRLLIQGAFAFEDEVLATRDLTHDFCVIAARRPD